MQLLDDFLTNSEVEALTRVAQFPEHHFDQLILQAGLDKSCDLRYANLRLVDFRGADLRGFDFTGADLRFSTIDSTTILDDSTILIDAKIEWIDEEDAAVVEYMLAAQSAISSSERRRALQSIVNNSSSADHVNKFLTRSIEAAGNLDSALDFCDFFVGNPPLHLIDRIAAKLSALIEKKANSATSRTRRRGTQELAVRPIIDRMSKSDSYPMILFLRSIMAEEEVSAARKGPPFQDYSEVGMSDIIKSIKHYRGSTTKPTI